jgi:S-adenosylmethionine:tRNA ribosyltransferase-isomerase
MDEKVRVDAFDFAFDEELIALHPSSPRDSARMLVVPAESGKLVDRRVRDLTDILHPGDLLLANDTKVVAAALTGRRVRSDTSASLNINLLAPQSDGNWLALARPAKRLRLGDRVCFGARANSTEPSDLWGTVAQSLNDGMVIFNFDLSSPELDQWIDLNGNPPLPPYIGSKRAVSEDDRSDYQTMFAQCRGAVAAPTAGLHFTDELVSNLGAKGVSGRTVTLHVGAGTFLPVKVDDIKDHVMHAEWGKIDSETASAINETRAAGGRLICVGTTTLRLVESAADEDGTVFPFSGETDIFITPGYRFRACDMLLTNFHLPRSTLFMLVAAFSGLERMKMAYAHAIANRYRFYSYGDACLLERAS